MTRKINDQEAFGDAKAQAAREQPRRAAERAGRISPAFHDPADQKESDMLQRLPLGCRLMIWEYVLATRFTRIERWRPQYVGMTTMSQGMTALDADCFPYRLVSTASRKRSEYSDDEDEDDEDEDLVDDCLRKTTLAILLTCRQIYIEALSALYTTTTFVFSKPEDFNCFRLTASPEGVTKTRRIIMAVTQIDLSGVGPLDWQNTPASQAAMTHWAGAVGGLQVLHLQSLQIWIWHHAQDQVHRPQRPWDAGRTNAALEERHRRLFDLFGSVTVPTYTIDLTWMPDDILVSRTWPFKTNLLSEDDIAEAMWSLPRPIEFDAYV